MLASLAVAALVRRATRAQTPPTSRVQRASLALGALAGGVIGAKLPFVLGDPEGAISGLAWISDGRTLTWGLVGGYLGVELAKWLSGVAHKTGDGYAAPVAAGVAVGRLGCFYAGCCFGAPTSLPWGADFGDGVMRHPTQLYEAAFHALATLALLWLARRGLFVAQRMKLYAIAYFSYRFVTEAIRPEPTFAWSLTFYQLSSLAFGALFAALWALDARALGRQGHAP